MSSNKIKEWIKTLPDKYFCQVHKSYVVAYHWIVECDSKNIILDNKHEVPISRRRLNDFSSKYENYIQSILR